jgi:stress-induced morphogen
VRMRGLEPPRPEGHTDLNRARLPIPPHPPRRSQCSPRRYDRSVSIETLKSLLEVSFPGAEQLEVTDRTGGGDHFQVVVAAAAFDGLSLLEQHKLIYAALAEPLADGTIHELRINTRGTA